VWLIAFIELDRLVFEVTENANEEFVELSGVHKNTSDTLICKLSYKFICVWSVQTTEN